MDIPNHFPHVVLDEFIIMPNHIHGIIKLDYSIIGACNDETSTGTCHGEKSIGTCHGMSLFNDHQKQFNKFGYPVPGSVSVIINHFKSAVKLWCNKNGYELFLCGNHGFTTILSIIKKI